LGRSAQEIAALLHETVLPQDAAPGAIAIGLVGRGIQSSRSPVMHEREGARLGIRYSYALIDFDRLGLPDEALGAVLEAAEALGFAGLNVTHPFKQAVIPFLSRLAEDAEAIGAVNTVVLGGGQRVGHNTDCWGFAESFREGLSGSAVQWVVQFGAGGAGAAVACALMELGVESLAIHDIDAGRAHDLVAGLSRRFPGRVRRAGHLADEIRNADGIVNTTPVGMAKYPGTPFPAELLSQRQWVAEIIYFPEETELLARARATGCRTLPGRGMAVYQAVRAFELFTGIVPDRAAMASHFEAAA
jgi:shikimate dehydrogenase